MDGAQGRPRSSEFVFARLRYDSGDWDYNPKVAANVLNSVVEYTNIRVYPEEVVIGASSTELLSFPFLFMTGHKLVRFTREERERLATARQLLRIAGDHAATPAERQAAYKRARRELDGLIVLPDATVAALEGQVAPGLDAGREPSDFRHH